MDSLGTWHHFLQVDETVRAWLVNYAGIQENRSGLRCAGQGIPCLFDKNQCVLFLAGNVGGYVGSWVADESSRADAAMIISILCRAISATSIHDHGYLPGSGSAVDHRISNVTAPSSVQVTLDSVANLMDRRDCTSNPFSPQWTPAACPMTAAIDKLQCQDGCRCSLDTVVPDRQRTSGLRGPSSHIHHSSAGQGPLSNASDTVRYE